MEKKVPVGYETVTLIINDAGEVASAACTCTLWNGHSRHRGLDCSHITEARSGHTSAGVKSGTAAEWRDGLRAAIQKYIDSCAAEVESVLEEGHRASLFIGPTGMGKSTAIKQAIRKSGAYFAQGVGASAHTPATMLGMVAQGVSHPGPIADAWSQARKGKTIFFLDELFRFPQSVSTLLINCMEVVDSALAERGGLYKNHPELAGQDILVISAPLWPLDICPAANMTFVTAANPWGTIPDPAVMRRVTDVRKFVYDPEVNDWGLAAHFTQSVWECIAKTFMAVKSGEIAVPFAFDSMMAMKGPDDTAPLRAYAMKSELMGEFAGLESIFRMHGVIS